VTFGSDAPRVRAMVGGKQVALCGPGSIKVAHTLEEHITGTELEAGCNLLVNLAETFLRGQRT
jgi:acetylornithine deacetylase/succinyl-diaminopimelate desuccinylase-like protein